MVVNGGLCFLWDGHDSQIITRKGNAHNMSRETKWEGRKNALHDSKINLDFHMIRNTNFRCHLHFLKPMIV